MPHITNKDIAKIREWQRSPLSFVKDVWGLEPQEKEFVKGKHITHQQTEILLAVEAAISGEAANRISVASGHGIGKSACLSWLIIWYLFTHKNAQVPCTAPTSEQMHDILWKELNLWLGKMPQWMQEKMEWSTGYMRITENPKVWFARAKTARKENPEALAGVHGDWVMFCIDEASGVPQEIFQTAEGALTGENVLVIMISNPTRLQGYFYDSHHSDKSAWQIFQFSSEESPIVDRSYVDRIRSKHGEESDEYRIRVLGQFPSEDAVDDKGFTALLRQADIRITRNDTAFTGITVMGVDPAGEGKDETTWVVRDRFKAKVVAREKVSTPRGIAEKTMTLMDVYRVDKARVYMDTFGEGSDAAQEMAAAGYPVVSINTGDPADDNETYLNKRAEVFDRIKTWMRYKGELVSDNGWDELLNIRYKRNIRGKMQIMPKDVMRRMGIPSPNVADALSITFVDNIDYEAQEREIMLNEYEDEEADSIAAERLSL